jgi:hypothetical protein
VLEKRSWCTSCIQTYSFTSSHFFFIHYLMYSVVWLIDWFLTNKTILRWLFWWTRELLFLFYLNLEFSFYFLTDNWVYLSNIVQSMKFDSKGERMNIFFELVLLVVILVREYHSHFKWSQFRELDCFYTTKNNS